MRAFVFTDKALERQAGRFVWLSVNTEKRENAALLGKFPVKAWPSFYVIDPATEKIVLRWTGGATVPQLLRVLDDGAKAVGGAAAPGGTAAPGAALAEADRFYAEGKYAEAAAGYRRALETLQPHASSYPRVVESLLFALSQSGQREACAALAKDAYPHLKATTSAANVAGSGLDCALGMKDGDPQKPRLVASLASRAREVVEGPKTGFAADDVSSVFGSLAEEREAAKDEAGAKKYLEAWAAYLEGEAARAKTPSERTVFDAHRVSACVALGQPERVVPALQLSEKDFPDDYNPPQRLAIAYGAMKKFDEALAASDRAMARAYGPRKLVVYRTRVDILTKRGDVAAARKTLGEMLAYAEGLPKEQVSERTIASIKKQLEAAN
jgi:tetratricopeptide (TPR) repeat protein